MNAHDPRPETGSEILALARQVLASVHGLTGDLRVEFREDSWHVLGERGEWRVIPDYGRNEGILFEVAVQP